MRRVVLVVILTASATPIAAQWLNFPTPGIPRSADGSPNLLAPAPRTADGKPDFNGLWRAPGPIDGIFRPDPQEVQPWARNVARQRVEEFFKTRPAYQCLPGGPESFYGLKRILQTTGVIAILNEDQTFRQIFLDGRTLENSPHPVWMGYSVGRWEGDALIVESNGFNDRTWLNNLGIPHTEALRMVERYRRLDFGHVSIDVTFTDPDIFTKPQNFTIDMELVTDTEMIEAVCEVGSDRWTGSAAEVRKSAVTIASELLARYVGRYSGPYGGRVRTVDVTLTGSELLITAFLSTEAIPLIAQADSLFTSIEGLSYEFVRDEQGEVTHVVEIHASGNYPFQRQR